MSRVSFFIDGFNLYHAIAAEERFRPYRWLDLTKLAKCFVRPQDNLTTVFYFTALATWDADKVARHRAHCFRQARIAGYNSATIPDLTLVYTKLTSSFLFKTPLIFSRVFTVGLHFLGSSSFWYACWEMPSLSAISACENPFLNWRSV
jgi:hypothetical protein